MALRLRSARAPTLSANEEIASVLLQELAGIEPEAAPKAAPIAPAATAKP